jgi:hypothetical protein
LGVHISFVRSIAMDSWTDKQLALMKGGGNDKCNQYLQAKGIGPKTPIKQKYESDHAQLYKEILKARIEGRPEPTSLPPPKPRQTHSAPTSLNRPMNNNGMNMNSSAVATPASKDPNGSERMAGESDNQYIARQTRLRDEAKARMAAKFGGNNRMGGVGSSGGGMAGIGSNPNYTPGGGGYGGGVEDVVNGVSSVFSSGLSFVGSAASGVTSFVQDDSTRASIGSFWGSISSGVSQVATSISQPDGDDGLAALQREFSSHRPAQSKYSGFGSSNTPSMPSASGFGSTSSSVGSMPSVGEAPGMPGEDRNGVGALTGETDEQYTARQNRLRDEAKARMAAKFGGSGLSGAGSSAAAAPSSGNHSPYNSNSSAPSSFGGVAAAPRSGGMPSATPPRKLSKDSVSGDDFFSSFGS